MKKLAGFVFIWINLCITFLTGVSAQTDSLRALLATDLPDTTHIQLLNELCSKLMHQNPDTCILLAKQALNLAEKTKYNKGIALTNSSLGTLYWLTGDNDLSLEHHMKALAIYQELNDKELIAESIRSIGNIYWSLENYDKALEQYFEAIEICKETGNKYTLAGCISNVGIIYKEKGDYGKARKHFIDALQLDKELQDDAGIATDLANIGITYYWEGDYPTALKFSLEALGTDKDLQNINGVVRHLGNISIIYMDQAKALSNSTLQKEIYNKAEASLLEALALADSIGYLRAMQDWSLTLSELYQNTGQYKSSLEYYQQYSGVRDSIFNETSSQQIAEMQTLYETEKKEQQITLQKAEIEKKEAEVRQQTTIKYTFFGGFIIMVLFALVVMRSYRQKKKANLLLLEQNEKIMTQNAEILQQKEEIQTQADYLSIVNAEISREKEKVVHANTALKSAYDKLKELEEFKESMTGMIVHDLKNPLNSIINLADGTRDKTMSTILQAGRQMLNMVLNILDVQKFEDTEISLSLKPSVYKSLIDDALEQTQLLAIEKAIQTENKVSPDLQANIDAELVQRIFVNLLTNAIKYTPVNGIISIYTENLSDKPDLIVFKVQDNGKGIPEDKLNTVFEKFSQVEAEKSGKARSTGLGLTFCKMVVEAHGGEIGVLSPKGEGATFYFTLPLDKDILPAAEADKQGRETEHTERVFALPENAIDQLESTTIAELQKLNIYETGQIFELLNSIDASDNNEISLWKSELENAVFSFNEEKFKELLGKSSGG